MRFLGKIRNYFKKKPAIEKPFVPVMVEEYRDFIIEYGPQKVK